MSFVECSKKHCSETLLQYGYVEKKDTKKVYSLLTKSKRTVFTIYLQGTVKMPVGSKITKSNYPFVPRSSSNAK